MANVKFRYSASSNITFNGVIETCISEEDWEEMSGEERDKARAEELFELVELYKVEE